MTSRSIRALPWVVPAGTRASALRPWRTEWWSAAPRPTAEGQEVGGGGARGGGGGRAGGGAEGGGWGAVARALPSGATGGGGAARSRAGGERGGGAQAAPRGRADGLAGQVGEP